MRQLFLAALGVFAVAGIASAQSPQPPYAPAPAAPVYAPAAAPLKPVSGTTVVQGTGCNNCGGKFAMATGGNCQYGSGCQNGCGSLKSDLAFHFGSCKNFFSPCGPTCGGGHGHGLFGGPRCPTLPLAAPYGTGWFCPRQYDSYANH